MKRMILLLCFVGLGLTYADAQMRLTLDEALKIALSENPTVKVAELEVERYDYVKKETWGNLLPQISVNGQYSRSIIKQSVAQGISFGADNTLSASGDISLPLFAPSVYRTLKMNRKQAEAAIESARASRINLVAEVKKAFFNILLAEQSLAVLRLSETIVKRTVDDTQLQYDNGLMSEYDLLTAQVQLSNLRPSIIQTENSIPIAKMMLKMYLSIPEDIDVEVIGQLDGMRDEVLEGTDNLSTDLAGNTDLRSLDLQAEILEKQLKLTNASRLPVISAFGNVTFSGLDSGEFSFDSTGAAAAPVSNPFWWQHPISAGVNVSIPIFAGLTRVNKARQVKNTIAQLDLQREYAERNTKLALQTAISGLMTARETMLSQEHTVQQAEKAYGISNTRYKAGAGTILELNSAQLAMTQAQLGYSQAIYDYLAAKADYDKIIGAEN